MVQLEEKEGQEELAVNRVVGVLGFCGALSGPQSNEVVGLTQIYF